MKPQGKAWLVAGVLALSAAACFNDPASDLRNGPAQVVLSNSFLNLAVNDTVVVNVQVMDGQGNPQSFTNPTYASGDAAVVGIAPLPDTILRTVPGNTLTKAIVYGIAAGTSSVSVTAAGLTGTINVVVQ